MLGSLRRTTNLLLVNLRGTGDSTLVKCAGLEHFGRPPHQYGAEFDQLVAACGRQLNHTWRYRHGGWVHASDLFSTAYSARDVSRVLRALRLGRVDLYGDSYGSWFAQVFASAYPRQLRSVTLDSTYQVLGLDPWYTTTAITARRAFAQACSRWPGLRQSHRRPRCVGPYRRAGGQAGPRPRDRRDHVPGRDRGQAHGHRRNAGQPGQQRRVRPGRLPRSRRRRASAAAPPRQRPAAAAGRALDRVR